MSNPECVWEEWLSARTRDTTLVEEMCETHKDMSYEEADAYGCCSYRCAACHYPTREMMIADCPNPMCALEEAVTLALKGKI